MRILTVGNMYPPHSLGGYEQVWRGAVVHLRDRGHRVRVLTTDYVDPEPDPGIAEDPDVHRELRWYWRDHDFPRIGLRARIDLERHNLARLQHHLSQARPHVVGWWAMGGMSLSLIEMVRRRALPAVGFVHDAWMAYGPGVDAWQRLARLAGPLKPVLERATGVPARLDLPSAARWLFVSEEMRDHALGIHGLTETAIAHSGIDAGRFAPAPAKPWRGRLLYIGRLDPRKGIHVAARAVAELPECSLTIAGGGDDGYRQELEALVAELDIGERVRFTVLPRDRVREAYANADAVLFPVLWDEPWGLVPLEAMAVGVPVVASGAGGSREYLRDGENCLLYAPRDEPDALARAVRVLAGNGDLRARLREGGLGTAPLHTAERFNEIVAAELEAAGKHPGRPPRDG